MGNMNDAIEAAFIGRLGSDPELRTSQAGKPWCRFSVAIGEGDDVQWISVSAFGETAERVCDQLAKGNRAYVEGTLRLNEWQDREGLTRHGLQVAAWKVEALGKIGRQKPRGDARKRDYQRPLDTDARPAQRTFSDDQIRF
jgi:single-strand DNA-binding protein